MLVSLRAALADVAVMAPPGRMVQVVAARAGAVPRVATRTAAPPAARMRAYGCSSLSASQPCERPRLPTSTPSLVPAQEPVKQRQATGSGRTLPVATH